MKRVMSFILIIMTLFTTLVFASETGGDENVCFSSDPASVVMNDYAYKRINSHLRIFEHQGRLNNNYYSISEGIQQFTKSGEALVKDNIYYYLVYAEAKVIGVLCVYENQDSVFVSTFSSSYAKQLNDSLVSSIDQYKLVSTEGTLTLCKGNEVIEVLESIDLDSFNMFTLNSEDDLNQNVVYISPNNCKAVEQVMSVASFKSKYINVPIVRQYTYPVCWAASMASIINYSKGTNYSSTEVANKTGHGISGATPTQVKSYYSSTFNLSSTLGDYMSSRDVFSQINNNRPIQVFHYPSSNETGHSLVLQGYSQEVGGVLMYSYMDSNYTNFRTIDIPISAQNNGSNVGIPVGGDVMYWSKSVYNIN